MKTSVWRFRRQAGTDPLKPVKEPEWLMQTGIQGIGAALSVISLSDASLIHLYAESVVMRSMPSRDQGTGV